MAHYRNILLKYPFLGMRDSAEATLLELAEVRISASYARNGKLLKHQISRTLNHTDRETRTDNLKHLKKISQFPLFQLKVI